MRNPKPAADAAAPAVDGLRALPDPIGSSIPSDPQTFAQITAAAQISGGLLLATGKAPRVASAALALTVLPANLGAHMFWSESDPQRKAEKRQAFLSDLSLLGGLMIASADTAGKPSLGWRGRRAAERLSERVSSALPGSHDGYDADFGELGDKIVHGLHVGAERGRELASTAAERGAPYAEKALERGRELASTAAERERAYAEAGAASAGASWPARRPSGARRWQKRPASAAKSWRAPRRRRANPLAKKARKRGEDLAETARLRARYWPKRPACAAANWPTRHANGSPVSPDPLARSSPVAETRRRSARRRGRCPRSYRPRRRRAVPACRAETAITRPA